MSDRFLRRDQAARWADEVQEFIKEAEGRDLRVFVIGGKAVAAMERWGAKGDFRSNLHRGGHAEAVKITPAERSTALKAARSMGLNVCGVDMLRSSHGPLVMEVNSSPGLTVAGFVTGTISSVSPITAAKPLSAGVTFTNALANFSIL